LASEEKMMRSMFGLVAVFGGLGVLVACSSHWSMDRGVDPIAFDLAEGPVMAEAIITLELDRKRDRDMIPCARMAAGLDLTWSAPTSAAVRVEWTDQAGEDVGVDVTHVEQGTFLSGGSVTLEPAGADRCEAVIYFEISSLDAVQGSVEILAIASDIGPATDDEPRGDVVMSAEVTVLGPLQ